jgi:simple sugar transport system permease protein
VTVEELNLRSFTAAETARNRLSAGVAIESVAEELGEEVQGFPRSSQFNRANEATRISPSAADLLFSPIKKGTVIGPYETTRGSRTVWYVARVSDQDILDLGDIYARIEERVLSQTDNRVNVINFWLPILLCSCGLVLTFSAGLWNIGVEGQMAMGAVGAASIALWVDLPRPQLIALELFMAAATGGAWALFIAILRTRGGVNEIFGGVAMNFIASAFTSYLVTGPWRPPNSTSTTSDTFPAKGWLPALEEYQLSPVTLGIALFCFLLVLVIMSVTRLGLQLRAMGKNIRSARILGVPTERNIWLAMTLCGAMAGLGGGHLVLFTRHNIPLNVSGGIGFLSLLVVLLAASRVVWVPFISLSFAFLFFSASILTLRFGANLDSSLAGVFSGLMVFSVFVFIGVRQRLEARWKRNRPLAESASENPPTLTPTGDAS